MYVKPDPHGVEEARRLLRAYKRIPTRADYSEVRAALQRAGHRPPSEATLRRMYRALEVHPVSPAPQAAIPVAESVSVAPAPAAAPAPPVPAAEIPAADQILSGSVPGPGGALPAPPGTGQPAPAPVDIRPLVDVVCGIFDASVVQQLTGGAGGPPQPPGPISEAERAMLAAAVQPLADDLLSVHNPNLKYVAAILAIGGVFGMRVVQGRAYAEWANKHGAAAPSAPQAAPPQREVHTSLQEEGRGVLANLQAQFKGAS